MKLTLPIVLAALGFAAAGCGGSASSHASGGTGSVAGTVATLPATTVSTSASFNAQVGNVEQRLRQGLRDLENGDLASGATLLTTCEDTVTKQLGSRASTASQQQSVSYLRTACDDVTKAETKLRHGDASAAKRLAKDALHQVAQAGG